MARPIFKFLMLALAVTQSAIAEPFVVEDMPVEMDSGIHPWTQARSPVAADFNGDGQMSWYAGGNRVAHPKEPTPFDPLRFATRALPSITLSTCPNCVPNHLAFAVADFDRDGVQDIARISDWTAQSITHTLQIFDGTGADNFTLGDRRDYDEAIGNTLGENFVQMRAGDFDRDGDPDLAILTTYQNRAVTPIEIDRGSLRIRWNNNGAFDSQTVLYPDRLRVHARLLTGDIDSDGDIDIVVNCETLYATNGETRFTQYWYNQGDGSYVREFDSQLEDNPLSEPLLFVDIDRNSRPEWVGIMTDRIRRAGFVQGFGFINPVDYSASLPLSRFFPGFGAQVLPAAIADFDEDGRLDIATAQGTVAGEPNTLILLKTQANHTAAAPEVIATFNASIVSIGAGDARGDADQDMLVRLEGGAFKLVRNTAQRLGVDRINSPIATMTDLTRIEAADSDRDGDQDLFVLRPRSSNSHLQQFLGNGNGGFSEGEFKILSNTPSDFVMADFNLDNRIDYAYTAPNLNAVRLVTQSDGSFFTWPDSLLRSYAGAANIHTGQVLIYDSRPDLFVSSNTTGGILALRNGNAGWSDSTPRLSSPTMPSALVMLPRYGILSDSPATCTSDGLSFQAQAYSLTFGWSQSAQLTQVQQAPQSGVCGTANLDNDAEMELIFIDGLGRLASWNPTNMPASPYSVISADVSGSVRALKPVDWNRDGLMDVLMATDQGLDLYARQGPTDAWQRMNLGNIAIPRDVVVIDLNRDNRPDAAYTTDSGVAASLNLSKIGEIGELRYPNGSELAVAPGQSAITAEREIINPGRANEDAAIAITSAEVFFKKAIRNGNVWNVGANMTPAEVAQAVASVSILVDGMVLGTASTNLVAANGTLLVNYNAVLGTLVPITAANSKYLQIRVTLKPTAAAAGYTEFFLINDLTTARVVKADGPTGKSDVVRAFTSPVIRIQSPDMLFSNGFE